MRKRIFAILFGVVLVFSLTACTVSQDKDGSGEDVTSISEDTQNDAVSTPDPTEEPSESNEEPEETSEPETGNFQGLEVEDGIEIELGEGDIVVVN